MTRKEDLEQHIRQSYRLIRDYEATLRLSDDPKEKARARHAIEEQWALIEGYLGEYLPLCRSLALPIPQDIEEIVVVLRARKGEEPPAPSPPAGRGVVIHGDVRDTVIITGDGNIVGGGRGSVRSEDMSSSPIADALANPFCDRGRINDPARLFDRRRILRELRDMLAHGNSISLVGPPQIGKSSLLYALYRTGPEWFPQGTVHYVDLQGVLDEEDFCEEVLRGMGREPGGLRALKKALRKERLVLLLDEVEKLTRPAFTKDLHDLLRSLAQEETLTLAVASHRPLEEIFPPSSDTSPFHNIFARKRLGPFTSQDARAFLRHRLRGTGVVFAPEEIERLVMESSGHPARLQELAYDLFEAKRR